MDIMNYILCINAGLEAYRYASGMEIVFQNSSVLLYEVPTPPILQFRYMQRYKSRQAAMSAYAEIIKKF